MSASNTNSAGAEGASSSDQSVAEALYFSSVAASNPYRAYQWYLDGYLTPGGNANGANIDEISTESSGRDIRIGLIDSGFDLSNADLIGRFDLALSYDPRDTGAVNILPDSAADSHGTWVAGVVGANGDNGLGTIGVAPDSTLVGYYARFGFGGSSRAELTDLLARQVNVDISNNSWGYTTPFADNFLDPGWAPMKDALLEGVTEGRGGLGTIYVFAAGNDRQYVANSTAYDGDNTNYHSLTNNRLSITVAASTQDGHIASFSRPGASILVTAPGDWIATTTPNDGDGDPANDYAYVSGTSFAAPIVSGVVAMMLEAHSDLGYRDVQEILALSSRKINPASASWADNGATNWNGGGNLVSNDFGFGLVDAHAAVRLAETWTTTHTAANESEISVPIDVGSQKTLLDFQPNSYTATVSGDFQHFSIDWVEVDVSLLHSHDGDLRIELISPTGTHSVLVDRPGAGNNNWQDLTFTLSTTHDWGESPAGTWQVVITDEGTGGIGSVASLALHIYGDDEGFNNTYYYTDEFATLSGDRATLTDVVGVDTINAAAVTTDMVLDLTPGATLMIAGRQVADTPATVIENAYGGDGNDVITGNSADNYLWGGAGNDVIDGKAGNDTMAGGAGLDRFVYAIGDGADKIADFSWSDGDIIDLGGAHVATYAELLACAAQIGADTVVGFGGADSLTLEGVVLAQLDARSFIFAQHSVPSDITLSNSSVAIFSNVGTVIGSLAAVNGDLGDTLTYSLLDDKGGLFAIRGANLVLIGAPAGPHSYDLAIQVTDSAGGTFGKDFTVSALTLDEFAAAGAAGAAHSYNGGNGDDVYCVSNPGDVVIEQAGKGIDSIHSLVRYTLPANVENLILVEGAGAVDGTGNGDSNTIIGNASDNVLDGGAGADALIGRAGDDTYIVDNAGDVVTEHSNEGVDTVRTSVSYTLTANVEKLVLDASAGAINGTGNDLDNWIAGNAANNVIDGGAGNDYMAGGAGDDVYYVNSPGDVVVENPGGGSDTVYTWVDYAPPANVETVVLMGGARNLTFGAENAASSSASAATTVMDATTDTTVIDATTDTTVIDATTDTTHTDYGDALDNLMIGGSGNDTFFAGDGTDTLIGGDGNDVLVANTTADLFSQEHDVLIGGAGNDTLYGEAADTLDGGAGFDVLQVINDYDMNLDLAATSIEYVVSGFGNDTYTAASGTTAIEVYGSGGNDFITGGSGDDRLWGGVGNDTLVGNDGNDVLVGDLGADSLSGGAGNDRLYIDSDDTFIDGGSGFDAAYIATGTGITLNMATSHLEWAADFAGGNDNIDASGVGVNVEIYGAGGSDILTGGSGNDLIFAGSGDDTIVGGDGNDALVGEAGADQLSGGDGNDRLYVDSDDTLIDGGAGYDAVYIVGGSGLTLNMAASQVEYVQDQVGGDDVIDASGAAIGVSVDSGAGNDAVIGGAGADVLHGGSGIDLLTGGAGDDFLFGESGNDRLVGGAGFDKLYGGAGADTFVATNGGDTDTVLDWEEGVDKLAFHGVAGLTDYSDLTIAQSGSDLEIFFGADKLFVLAGVTHIGANDLLFT